MAKRLNSHLFRMNPQVTRRRRTSVSVTTVFLGLVLAGSVVLYWIGKLHLR